MDERYDLIPSTLRGSSWQVFDAFNLVEAVQILPFCARRCLLPSVEFCSRNLKLEIRLGTTSARPGPFITMRGAASVPIGPSITMRGTARALHYNARRRLGSSGPLLQCAVPTPRLRFTKF